MPDKVAKSIDVAAPAEKLWDLVSTSEGLSGWFVDATVVPGAQGSVTLRFGCSLAWLGRSAGVTGESETGEHSTGTDLAAARADESIPKIQRRFERMLSASRLLILLPVVMLLLIAAGTFVYGSVIFFASITGYIHDPARVGGKLSHFLIVEDLFLVGVTLMISAFGFYGLFVIRGERRDSQYWLPKWLQMRDLDDLKARVVSMLILVAAMTFVDVVVEFHGGLDVFYLGVGVSLVIVALTAFLRFGRQAHARSVSPAPSPDQDQDHR